MNKFRFLEWDVYKDAQNLTGTILDLVKNLSREYRLEIGGQLIRSAFSVVLNIAEGSGKGSDKESNRFLNIALGSLYEVVAGVDTLKSNKLVSNEEFKKILSACEKISDQLGGFKKNLKFS